MPASRHRRSPRQVRPLALLLSAMLVAALLPATVAGAADAPTFQPRVFGGVDADIEVLPSLAFLYNQTRGGACTGTVIAPRWVLTAAHCFGDLDDTIWVLLEEADISGVFLDDFVETDLLVVHPEWNLTTEQPAYADIALVRLSEATSVPPQPLVAAGTPHPVGAEAVIAGWGEVGPNQEAEVLQRGTVPVVEGGVCAFNYGFALFQEPRQICAGGEVMDTCQGDSGGPLMVEVDGVLVQYGLTAFGLDAPCGSQDIPAVYTSVSFYRSWIEEVSGITSVTDDAPDPDDDAGPDPDDDAGPDPDDDVTDDEVIEDDDTDDVTDPDDAITEPDDDVIDEDDGAAPDPDDGAAPDPDDDVGDDDLDLDLDTDPEHGLLPAPPPASEAFSDVSDDHPHAEGIAWVAAAEITTGFSDGTFKPGQLVTRGQMATFLVRASDDLEPSDEPPPFSDVEPGSTHARSIAAVAEAGITTGRADGTFGPDQPVTRGQMATFLVRASDLLEPSEVPPPFADVDPGNTHAPSIAAVADAGIAGGFADGTYGPDRDVTRGQMATFLARTFLWFGPTPPGSD